MNFFSLLTSPQAVFSFAGLLVLLAFISGVQWGRLCTSLIDALRGAEAVLSRYPGNPSLASVWTSAETEIGTALARVPSLRGAWESFTGKVTLVVRHGNAAELLAEAAPGEAFRTTELLRPHAIHWYRSLPNYLIGLGLCFTFVGVALVIRNASLALSGSLQAAEQSAALRELLHATSFKFTTSLVGILCSIAYSIWYRWNNLRLDRALAQWLAALGRRIETLNPGSLLHRALDEQQRQNAWLAAICGSLDDRATARIEGALDSLGGHLETALDGFAARVAEMNQTDLECIAQLATDGVNRALTEQVQCIGATLETVHGRLAGLVDCFTDVARAAGALKSEFAQLLDSTRACGSEVGASFSSAADSAREVRAAFGEAGQEAATLAAFPTTVSAAVDQWRGVAETLRETGLAQRDATALVRGSVNSLEQLWQNQAQHFGEADRSLAQAVGSIQGAFEAYAGALHNYTGQLDGQLAKALRTLDQSVRQMNEAPEQLRAAASDVRRAMLEGLRGLENLPVAQIDALSRALAEAAAAMARAQGAGGRARGREIPAPPETDRPLVP